MKSMTVFLTALPWRTHSCVPCSHSCEHKVAKEKGVHTSVNAARLGACATCLITAVLCLTLTACMVGPKYHPPATAQAPPAYKELNPPPNQPAPLAEPAADPTLGGLGDWKPANPQETLPHGKWWEIYNDPELNALETQLNIDNQNIR
jgi:hypothetical protein